MRIQIKSFNKTENPKIKRAVELRKTGKLDFPDFIRIAPIQITII